MACTESSTSRFGEQSVDLTAQTAPTPVPVDPMLAAMHAEWNAADGPR